MKDLKNILKLPQIEQLTDQWFKIRHNLITASQCATVLDENKYQTKKDLLDKKCDKLNINKPNIYTSWGSKYEEVAFKIYSNMYNIKLYNLGLIIHKKYKWLGASPDGIRSDCRLLEIKCPKFRNITTVPRIYWIQTQIQMEVLDLDECDLFQCKFVEVTEDEYNILKDSDIISGKNNDNTFWKLLNYKCDTIKRDKEWFKLSKPILKEFYETFIYLRKNVSKKRKRKYLYRKSKKIRYIDIEWNKWIYMNELDNHILNDPILYWLDLYGIKNGYTPNYSNNEFDFNNFLTEKREEFKNKIYNDLNKKFNIVKICNSRNYKSLRHFNETINEMKKGTPLIYNGLLLDFKNKIYGNVDLLVRSDYINKIYEKNIKSINNGCIFSDKWHYKVVSLRFNTMKLH